MTESHYRVALSDGSIQNTEYETFVEAWAAIAKLPGFYVVKIESIRPVYELWVNVIYKESKSGTVIHAVRLTDRFALMTEGQRLVDVLKACSTVSDAGYEIVEVKGHG